MTDFLNPNKTLLINQDWLYQQLERSKSLSNAHGKEYTEAKDVKSRWASESTDREFRTAIETGEARLVTRHFRTNIAVESRHWMRYFLALAVQNKSRILRFKVGDYVMPDILVDTNQGTNQDSSRYFKLNLQYSIRQRKGEQFLPSFFGSHGFSLLGTSLVYSKPDEVYGLVYEKYLLMAGSPAALANVQAKLATYFEFDAVPNDYTYLDMHVNISEYQDGHSVSIDCEEATQRWLARKAEAIGAPAGPAHSPVNREDVDMALKIEEAVLAKTPCSGPMARLGQPLDLEEFVQYERLLRDLEALEDCGRMDICAVRVYLDQHGPVQKVARQIHMKMLQHLCHYLKTPYRIKYTYKAQAEFSTTAMTRWLPLPTEVYAWYLGDCPIKWKATCEQTEKVYLVFGIRSLQRALKDGTKFFQVAQELGLSPTEFWQPEVFTLIFDAHLQKFGELFHECRIKLIQEVRRCEPFTYAKPEDAKVDVGRTKDQLQAEMDRRAPIVDDYKTSAEASAKQWISNYEDSISLIT